MANGSVPARVCDWSRARLGVENATHGKRTAPERALSALSLSLFLGYLAPPAPG